MRLGNVHGIVILDREFGVRGRVHVVDGRLGLLVHATNHLNGHSVLGVTLGERGPRLCQISLGRLKGQTSLLTAAFPCASSTRVSTATPSSPTPGVTG